MKFNTRIFLHDEVTIVALTPLAREKPMERS